MNYEFKGSKAPWVAKDPFRYTSDTPSANSIDIYSEYDGVDWKWVASIHGENVRLSAEKMEANAHLIAAAPDLLQACIDTMAALENIGVKNSVTYDRMKQAIHKALNITL